MWEKKKSRVWLTVLLIIIAAALVFALVKAYLYVSAETKAQDAALVSGYVDQKQQEESPTLQQASLDDLNAEYRKDMDCVAQYLPGIVCWGDTLTAGSASGVSFPRVLQDKIDEAINDKYSFVDTISNAGSYTKVDWESYDVNIPVVNMGSGEETTGTVLARNGAESFITKSDLVIPAACEAVEITFTCADGSEANPLTEGDVGVNPVTIAGVEGKLAVDLDSLSHSTRKYTFTRSTPGAEVSVPAGSEITCSAASLYRDYIPVIFIGTYGGYKDVQSLIAQQKDIINHQIANQDRYIIIGLYYLSAYSYNNGGSLTQFDQYEAAMLQEYGNHFINLRKYLVSDGLTDAGISATKNDESYIKNGLVPPSLKSSKDGAELNATGYTLLGNLVYDRMDMLGYFDEVKDELGITAQEKLEKKTASTTAG